MHVIMIMVNMCDWSQAVLSTLAWEIQVLLHVTSCVTRAVKNKMGGARLRSTRDRNRAKVGPRGISL